MPRTLGQKQVERVSAGDHLCLTFDSDAVLRAVATAYIRDGLRTGQRVVYLTDSTPRETLLGWLSASPAAVPCDVQDALDRQQLEIVPAAQLYLEGGRFQPGKAVSALREAIAATRTVGYTGLRVAGEMSWALRGDAGSEPLAGYERDVQSVFGTGEGTGEGSGEVIAICLYDRRRFDADLITELALLHSDGCVGPNAYYEGRILTVLPTFSPVGLALEGEIDLTVHAVITTVLERLAGETDGDLYVNCSCLRFCDVGGLRRFVRFGARLAAGGRTLVLHSAPRFLTETLRLSGWADYPGVVCVEGNLP